MDAAGATPVPRDARIGHSRPLEGRTMRAIETSAYQVAQRFTGIREVDGSVSNPQILAMLRLDDEWPQDDAAEFGVRVANPHALQRVMRVETCRTPRNVRLNFNSDPELRPNVRLNFDSDPELR
jgi:hypothetical protein